jgi:hypothetical protein
VFQEFFEKKLVFQLNSKNQVFYSNVNFHPSCSLFPSVGCYKLMFKVPYSFDQCVFAFSSSKCLEFVNPSFKVVNTFSSLENDLFQTEVDLSKKIPQKFHYSTMFQFDSSLNKFTVLIKPFTPNFPFGNDYLSYFQIELVKKRQDLTVLHLLSCNLNEFLTIR